MMRLPMVDCRSLLQFCRAFERHNSIKPNSSLSRNTKRTNHNFHNNFLKPPCQHPSPLAAIELIVLLLVLGSLGFLIFPYLSFIYRHLLPVISRVIKAAPFAYFAGMLFALIAALLAWELINLRLRKCGNPHCRGLRNAVEFDIQLESEECVKYLKSPPDSNHVRPLELGEDHVHRELEAELKRMAPLNGRTVLIFRAPCGCPAARLEVWGNKKLRRIKK